MIHIKKRPLKQLMVKPKRTLKSIENKNKNWLWKICIKSFTTIGFRQKIIQKIFLLKTGGKSSCEVCRAEHTERNHNSKLSCFTLILQKNWKRTTKCLQILQKMNKDFIWLTKLPSFCKTQLPNLINWS